MAVLWHPAGLGERTAQMVVEEAEAAARSLGVQLQLVRIEAPTDLDAAFVSMTGWRADALIPLASPMVFAVRERIIALAARHRLPTLLLEADEVIQ